MGWGRVEASKRGANEKRGGAVLEAVEGGGKNCTEADNK